MGKDQEGVFVTEEFDGAEDRGSGDNTTVNVETLLEAFLEDFQTWDYFPKPYQDFWSISI
jgi:hypothetical protein